MRAYKKITAFVAVALTLLTSSNMVALADEAGKTVYTYTIQVYTGDSDIVFTSADFEIADASKAEGVSASLSSDKTVLTVSGLKYGTSLNLAVDGGKLAVDSSKTIYTVKGLRQAGHDETNAGVISVTKDAEYVVAYGVLTNPVTYKVKYVDENDGELLAEDTFIGNAGEKIEIAFRSVENFLPNTFRYAVTLNEDPEQNVFTFKYYPSKGVNIFYNTITGEVTYVYEDGTTTVVYVPAAEIAAGNVPAAPANPNANPVANNADQGEVVENADENEITDENVPLTNDVVDLDDEDVPLADQMAFTLTNAAPIIAAILGGLAAVAIVVLVVVFKKRNSVK